MNPTGSIMLIVRVTVVYVKTAVHILVGKLKIKIIITGAKKNPLKPKYIQLM